MGMAALMAFNQVVSHGFGLFLFVALVPEMRMDMSIEAWHLAFIGAGSQVSYLIGAALLGVWGHKLPSNKLLLVSGLVTASILFSMIFIHSPIVMIFGLCLMAISAAICWGGIVEIIAGCSQVGDRSTHLSIASSGTAWGYGLNGLLLLTVVPASGWQAAWFVAGMIAVICLLMTSKIIKMKCVEVNSLVSSESMVSLPVALSTKELLKVVLIEPVARSTCLILFLVGLATMPFSTWLNIYLAELAVPNSVMGFAWLSVGVSGMVSGLIIGRLADRKGSATTLFCIFSIFFVSSVAFVLDPARWVLLVSVAYGLMYFPVWGILAGWVNRAYSSKATMQINGIGMITFGAGGVLGNALAGVVQQYTGSISSLFEGICVVGFALVLFSMYLSLNEFLLRRHVVT